MLVMRVVETSADSCS